MTLTAHRAVLIDAIATTVTAVLMLATRPTLYPTFGLSSPFLLDVAAAAFLVYAAIIGIAATRPAITRTTLLTIAGANAGYVIASVAVLVTFWSALPPAGRVLIAVIALTVEVFAMLQFTAARRLATMSPA